jgi:hypothetical protein
MRHTVGICKYIVVANAIGFVTCFGIVKDNVSPEIYQLQMFGLTEDYISDNQNWHLRHRYLSGYCPGFGNRQIYNRS